VPHECLALVAAGLATDRTLVVALGFTDVEQVHVMLSLLLVLESEEAKQVDAWNSEIVSHRAIAVHMSLSTILNITKRKTRLKTARCHVIGCLEGEHCGDEAGSSFGEVLSVAWA